MVKKAAVSIFLLVVISVGIFLGLSVQVIKVISPWHLPASVIEPNTVSADAWAIFDTGTGEILDGRNMNVELPMASVTKFLFADAALADESIFNTISITWSDLNAYGAAGSLYYGQELSLYTLLFPLLLVSSNDAAAALDRNLPSLLDKLNKEFNSKGLAISLADSSGLSANNVATAKDLAFMSADIYQRRPHLLNITSLPYYAVEAGAWSNSNPVSDMSGFLGGKNGYTDIAQHTLVAFFEEDEGFLGAQVLGYVLLGSSDLRKDLEILRSYVAK